MVEPTASAHVDVAASPEAVYRMLTDLDVLAEISEELESCAWLDASSLRPGARFRGFNRNGDKSWSTVATVRVAEGGRRFAFDVDDGDTPVSHWSYELVPTDEGCRVVESTWDRRPSWYTPVSAETTGESDREGANQRNIEHTLRALKKLAERD
ncbi:Polyketide cyclase / dehydrase and lipid transport [Actinopolyspora xinjiangensis]|uniref:Polyketide cyclase / dehydrase and lipid transport n=1 Tax=Actinopolyspora xinjiangensis TaxID=405564 RepID=A0A1H0RTD4_9ACTN|nr:SRPBCC family protein [Actinopolyspora xinjiangensis]SDP32703.1 Polyketide cyclase / dehydrase and lipid transport [Actinopolyspora xinjiangensis]